MSIIPIGPVVLHVLSVYHVSVNKAFGFSLSYFSERGI